MLDHELVLVSSQRGNGLAAKHQVWGQVAVPMIAALGVAAWNIGVEQGEGALASHQLRWSRFREALQSIRTKGIIWWG